MNKIYDLICVKFVSQGNVNVNCIIPEWILLDRERKYNLMSFSKGTMVQRLVHDKNVNLIKF